METNKIDLLVQEYNESKEKYEDFGGKIVQIIEELLKETNLECHSINYRIKKEDSFCNKLQKKINITN